MDFFLSPHNPENTAQITAAKKKFKIIRQQIFGNTVTLQ